MASDDRSVSQHLDRDLDHRRHADSPDAMVDQGQQKRCFVIFLKTQINAVMFSAIHGSNIACF